MSYFIEAPLIYHDYAKYKVIVYSAVVGIIYESMYNASYNFLMHFINFKVFAVYLG
jgi:hypothetical protein